jgi:hypothetical protein
MEQTGFQHEALIYEGAEDYLAGTLPFLREGLAAGEPVLVAVRRPRAELIEEGLGEDAKQVRFLDMGEVGRNPASIIPLWRDFVEESGGRSVRGISEPVWADRTPAEVEECHRHEALLNVAFAPRPRWSLLCPYEAALGEEVLEKVAITHRWVSRHGRKVESSAFDPDPDCFEGALPPPAATPETQNFGIAANSVMHGGGSGTLRLWRENGSLLTEVKDRGTIEEPLVGRLRPGISQEGGRGLWLANQLCDLVQIRSGANGTTVRLHMPAPQGTRSPWREPAVCG